MTLEMKVNKFWLIMRTDQLFLTLSDLFSSQNQNVPYKKFLRKLGFLAAPSSNESLAQARVARSGFLPGGGWLWSKHPGAAAHRGAQRSAGEKATAWDCLDTPPRTLPPTQVPGRLHSSLSEEVSSRQLCPFKQEGEKVPRRKETGIASDSESCAWEGRGLPLSTHSTQGTVVACVARAREAGTPQGRKALGSWGMVAMGATGLACPIQTGGGHVERKPGLSGNREQAKLH